MWPKMAQLEGRQLSQEDLNQAARLRFMEGLSWDRVAKRLKCSRKTQRIPAPMGRTYQKASHSQKTPAYPRAYGPHTKRLFVSPRATTNAGASLRPPETPLGPACLGQTIPPNSLSRIVSFGTIPKSLLYPTATTTCACAPPWLAAGAIAAAFRLR